MEMKDRRLMEVDEVTEEEKAVVFYPTGIPFDNIDRHLDEQIIVVGDFSPLVVPVTIIADFSGSMGESVKIVGDIVGSLKEKLQGANNRFFELILISIYKGKPIISYIGDLDNFDICGYKNWIPKLGSGTTPLTTSYMRTLDIMDMARAKFLEKGHVRTAPVVISISDAGDNDHGVTAEAIRNVEKAYRAKVESEEIILVEFVPESDIEGLNLGGYRVALQMSCDVNVFDENIKKQNDEIIKSCTKAIAVASTTTKEIGGQAAPDRKIVPRDYENYATKRITTTLKDEMDRIG